MQSMVNGSEDIPQDAPEALGFGFKMRAYVNSDHAGDSTTRRSKTSSFIVYLNNAPIYHTSKKQTIVDTTSFGSEFIAMKTCREGMCIVAQ